MHKDWNHLDHFSVLIIVILSFLGAMFNTKRFCKTNTKCKEYKKTKLFLTALSHIVFDFVSIGTISLIVYIGLVGYGFNELLSVAIAGFLAKEGNTALYQIKLVIADKLGSSALIDELKKEKEVK